MVLVFKVVRVNAKLEVVSESAKRSLPCGLKRVDKIRNDALVLVDEGLKLDDG